MKTIFKSMILFTLVAVLLAMWLPNFILGFTVSADDNVKGSTIGGVEVGNLKGEELVNVLNNAVTEWYEQAIVVSGGGSSIEVRANTFQFDIEGTVENYEKNYVKKWFEVWASNSNVHLPLNIQPSEIVKNEISNISTWNTEDTYERVQLNASYLKTEEIEAVVEDLSELEVDRMALLVQPIPEGAIGMDDLILELNDTIIESYSSFSMLESLSDTIHLANNEAVNFMASNIYNLALQSNAEILERHSQHKIPTYLKPGLEAKVDTYKTEDFRFLNNSSTPIKLKLSLDGENLVAEVYTTLNKTNVSVFVSRDEVIQPSYTIPARSSRYLCS